MKFQSQISGTANNGRYGFRIPPQQNDSVCSKRCLDKKQCAVGCGQHRKGPHSSAACVGSDSGRVCRKDIQ